MPVARSLGVSYLFRLVSDVVSLLTFIKFAIGMFQVEPEGLKLISLVVFKFGSSLFNEFGETGALVFDGGIAFSSVCCISCLALDNLLGSSCTECSLDDSILGIDGGKLGLALFISLCFGIVERDLESMLEVVVVDVRNLLANRVILSILCCLFIMVGVKDGVNSELTFVIEISLSLCSHGSECIQGFLG